MGLVEEAENIEERLKMESFLLRLASITEIPLVKAERIVRNMLLRDGVDEAFTKTRWGWVTLGLTIQDAPMDLWKMEYRPKPAGLNQPWPDPPTPLSVFRQQVSRVEMTVDMHKVPLRDGYFRWMVFIPREDAPEKFLVWQDYCRKVMSEIVAKYWYKNFVIHDAPPEPSDEWKPEEWMSPKPEVHLTQETSARAQGLLPPEAKPTTIDETWKQRRAELERAREAWNAIKRQSWPVRLAVDNSRKDEE